LGAQKRVRQLPVWCGCSTISGVMETGMTVLVVIWVIFLLVFALVYWKPGYRNSGAMVRLYPAGRKTAGPSQDSAKADQAA